MSIPATVETWCILRSRWRLSSSTAVFAQEVTTVIFVVWSASCCAPGSPPSSPCGASFAVPGTCDCPVTVCSEARLPWEVLPPPACTPPAACSDASERGDVVPAACPPPKDSGPLARIRAADALPVPDGLQVPLRSGSLLDWPCLVGAVSAPPEVGLGSSPTVFPPPSSSS
ncbi:hypothetical protein TcCL_NonESM10527 [Trypanosoma cruzi]|nr:hypothetical protein TcCL_NonESM10527 [Trypanosoma cruzi]